MLKILPSEKKLVAIVSIALGVTMAFVSLASFFILGPRNMPLQWDQLLVAGLMIALFPAAAVEYLDFRWRRGIDKNIPRLLREIAESSMTGLTLARAIEVSSERDYGPLTPELKRVITQISLGSSFEDAMKALGTRCRTKLAQRTATLVSEVSRSGGDTKEIMEQLNKHIGELQTIDRERHTQMLPYSAVVYVAFGVFLFVDIMLIRTFFTQIVAMQRQILQTAGGAGISVFGAGVDLDLLKRILFHATVIQAIFGGLIAGKMSEGKLGAGLKHTILLLLMTFLSFFIFVWSA